MQFPSLFATIDVSKYEIRNQWECYHYILRSNATLDSLILINGTKTKLVMLAFLYCGEIVKNSIGHPHFCSLRCHFAQRCHLLHSFPLLT